MFYADEMIRICKQCVTMLKTIMFFTQYIMIFRHSMTAKYTIQNLENRLKLSIHGYFYTLYSIYWVAKLLYIIHLKSLSSWILPVFLDELASLNFNLSVSHWVIYVFLDFQIILTFELFTWLWVSQNKCKQKCSSH